MTVALGLVAVFVLTAATGYFVAQEFAYVTADRLALRRAADEGDKRAARAVRVLERLSFMLSGAQLGITVTTLVVGFIAKPALAEVISPLLEPLGISSGMVDGLALGLGFALATVIQMVLGELLPKNLAMAKPEELARILAPSTLLYLRVAAPLIKLFDSAANRLLRAVGVEPVEELHHGATLQELGHIIGESEQHLDHEHVDLLERALVFSDHTADEAMIPRVDVVTVSATATVTEINKVMAEHGHTHYPVLGDRVDDIMGVVGLRELLPVPPEREGEVLARDIARPAIVLPGSLALPDVFAEMHDRGDEVVCVIDEYGGFAGMLTLEDVAEELVGEIADEDDLDHPLALQRSGWWHLDAGLRIDETAQVTGVDLPEGDYDTVAGLIQHRLGRLARAGDLIHLTGPDTDISIEVLTIDHHVPERIRLRGEPVLAEDQR
ncbi:hemolysin family protein [Actinocorallia longicatena]|uniref:Hemolysin family protein n=1 Tax=Actinocorallia longicatena TaxID=111803 RepID=A0ABP6Q3Q7_9ACTN